MTSKPESESLFEQFCALSAIHCKRIEPDGQKIPDYDLFIGNKKIVVEVKQLEPNPEESHKINQLNTSGTVTIKTEPGKRARGKITDSQGKFNRRTQDNHPSILVLYDNVKYHKHTEPFDILAAMYGQPYFPIEYSDSSAQIGNMKHGPKRKMTKDTNTSISAIGVLKKDKDGNPNLTIFHNKYSKVPLDHKLFAKFSVKQYIIEDENNSIKWKEIIMP
jgi:hypothetical protein